MASVSDAALFVRPNSALHVHSLAGLENGRAAALPHLDNFQSGIGNNICNTLIPVDRRFVLMNRLFTETRLKRIGITFSGYGNTMSGLVLIDRIGVRYYGVVVESN